MCTSVICDVGDIDRSCIRKYFISVSIINELIACLFQKLNCLCQVVIVCFIGRIIISNCICIRIGVSIIVLTELTAIAICHTCRNKGICKLLTCLANVLYDIITVDQKAETTSHCRCLLRSLACKQITVYVERYIVGTKVINDMEFRIVQKALDFIRRNSICEIKVACIVCGINRSIIRTQHELKTLDLNFICTIVVRVLYVYHALVMCPALKCVSTAGYKSCFLAPCARVILPSVSSLNACLRNCVECRECAKVKEVCTRRHKIDGKGLSILTCSYIQCSIVFSCDRVKHVCVVSTCLCTCSTIPGINKIICVQICAIAPLQAIS